MEKSKDVVIYFGGMLFQQAVTFLSAVFVARWLGPGDYGVMSISRNIYTFILILAPLGLDLALLKHLAGMQEWIPTALAHIRLFRIIVAIAASAVALTMGLVIAPLLQAHVYHIADFSKYVWLTFISLPFAADVAVMAAVFRAAHKPMLQSMIALYVQPVVRLISLLVLLRIGWGLSGVISSNIVAGFATCALLGYLFSRWRNDQGASRSVTREDFRAVKTLLSSSIWMAMTLLVYGLLRIVDVLVLGMYRTPAEVGNYAALGSIAVVIQFLPQALSQTLGPTVAKRHQLGDIDGMRRVLDAYLRRSVLLTAPLFGAIAFFGRDLDLVLGSKFHFELSISVCLAAGYLISATLAPMGYSLSMTGRHRLEFGVLCVGTGIVTVLLFILVPKFGALGAGMAVLFGYGIVNVVRFHYVRKIHGIRLGSLAEFVPPLACVSCAAAANVLLHTVLVRNLWTVLGSGVFYLVLIAGAYWFWLLNSEEKAGLQLKLANVSRRLSPA